MAKPALNIKDLLQSVITEALAERDRKMGLEDPVDEAVGDVPAPAPVAQAPAAPGAAQATPSPAATPSPESEKKMADADIETKDVVEKLNSIRSGKSFKDSAVAGPMEEYINGLEPAEKTALYAFLQGISQIVTGEVPGSVATEPSDPTPDVKMQKQVKANPQVPPAQPAASAPQARSVKPNVVRGGSTGAEDTSAPRPITPRAR